MGSQKTPETFSPGEAAQAAVGTAGAGEMSAIANQPTEQYANLYTNTQLGPAQMKTQQALANEAALQGAQAQKDIQSRVDPMAYAQREMRLQSATNRLGKLYGVDPSAFTYRAPSAYQVADMRNVASLGDLASTSGLIAKHLYTSGVSSKGDNPYLIGSGANINAPVQTTPVRSYF